jgi:hypothetical protein
MSEQQQPQISPELQFEVQLRAAALEQALKLCMKVNGASKSETVTQDAMVFLHFLRTGIAINEGE